MADRLEPYRGKRDPRRTREPIPETAPEAGGDDTFVIQEHHARSHSFSVGERGRDAEPSVVWSDDSSYSLTEGESVVVRVQTSDPFSEARRPQSGRDYLVRSGGVTELPLPHVRPVDTDHAARGRWAGRLRHPPVARLQRAGPADHGGRGGRLHIGPAVRRTQQPE
ncbi:hypothetical protein Pph01_72640 [Planotetraspora phitsanulokensis]|uniref:Uncharacterized protein n=1 Tax=Planotetraspora phitsanulokensis TaxID=575192 RepID=A0A8J3XJP5_9ACTN|nr:hypothetical protein Pph01_72640 [Planotetraspora phitsanulokensis]